jgi:redox-sensitive bicupin YhaK (pirin superfamily)
MIRTVSIDGLGGHRGPGIEIRDHFRKTPENIGTPHYCLGPLRTLAETTIEVGAGFHMHAHAEMEIVSYVRNGVLVHQDTLGNSGTLSAGDVQAMTTGTGIRHSEVNGGDGRVRMYQVWIEPDENGLAPSYVDLAAPKNGKSGVLSVFASGMNTRPGGALIRVDAAILGGDLKSDDSVEYALTQGRQAYVVAAAGRLSLNGAELAERDGAAVSDLDTLTIMALENSDVLVFDMPVR